MHFTQKIIDFLLLAHKKNFITRDSQKMLDNLQFYMMTSYLKKNGLMKVNGITKERQQIWVLTEKGKKICEMLEEIKKIMEES
jgi:predicted transcriptional regulator